MDSVSIAHAIDCTVLQSVFLGRNWWQLLKLEEEGSTCMLCNAMAAPLSACHVWGQVASAAHLSYDVIDCGCSKHKEQGPSHVRHDLL